MDQKTILITGANGQLGTELSKKYPNAVLTDSEKLNITDENAVNEFDWANIKFIINCAAYTDVDEAETTEGRKKAWLINSVGVKNLVRVCYENDITLIHISTDYVFDGIAELHDEEETLSPLGVYACSKASGDIIAGIAPKHYILRTSWIMGSGKNFVRSIYGLGQKSINPNVVSDQFGRPTFTDELVDIIDHILKHTPEYGIYNASNDGDVVSWSDIARQVYTDAGFSDLEVGDTTAEEYFAGKVSSPRPINSALNLNKLKSTGYNPKDWRENLKEYISKELIQ